ncbi:anti-sigma factor [Caulobacter sp. AP07]|uniref:zf-HC2 domain-containing protein n=1 Tax=Caulobacter sp. AP07 TaxID=1144304 RepID=UPI0002721B0A|nr:zf-HC2 domain-containing protein [Caulobacter sp. AP07]EJL33357.1 anti-sigma factor [Caulobacter sp. AP07]
MAFEHPSAALLSDYDRGGLAPGAALAVVAHLDLCRQCRLALGRMENRRWTKATSRNVPDGGLADARGRHEAPSAGGPLPRALRRIAVGRWRPAGRGVASAPLQGVSGLGESVHLLKAAPGTPFALPDAAELLLVATGAVQVGLTRYGGGDFLDLAATRVRHAAADARTGCLCLVVGGDELYRSHA